MVRHLAALAALAVAGGVAAQVVMPPQQPGAGVQASWSTPGQQGMAALVGQGSKRLHCVAHIDGNPVRSAGRFGTRRYTTELPDSYFDGQTRGLFGSTTTGGDDPVTRSGFSWAPTGNPQQDCATLSGLFNRARGPDRNTIVEARYEDTSSGVYEVLPAFMLAIPVVILIALACLAWYKGHHVIRLFSSR